MRRIIRSFDGLLRRAYHIVEFCDDPTCLIRLRVRPAPYAIPLPDGRVPPGAPVLELHIWNEHIPPLPPDGPDAAWAARTWRLFVRSLHAVAHQMQRDPVLADVSAVGGVTALFPPSDQAGGGRLAKRLGFVVLPYRHRLGRFGEFWENLYSWAIMWAFNAASLRRRHLLALRRTEVWMSATEFRRRYGHGVDSSRG